MPLLDIEQKGGWYKVKDLDGEIHWVYSTLVSRSHQCLVIKSSRASLRTGPGSKYPNAKLRSADKYTPFKKLDSEGPWYLVEDVDGSQFWVHENLTWRALKVQKIGF